VWLGNNAYKINLLDVNGVQQANFPMDNISSISTNISAELAASTTISQGQGLVGFNSTLSYPLGTLPGDLSDTTNIINGDALIGVLQPFTGAVARTQHSKNADVLSVLDFGAVGDGVTDDTVAVQKAITYAVSNNKAVEVVGLSYITSSLYINRLVNTQTNTFTIFADGSGQGFLVKAGVTLFDASPSATGTSLVSAGAFVVGQGYIINAVGSTNFTAIGATSNTSGVTFEATGVGTGTGTAWHTPFSDRVKLFNLHFQAQTPTDASTFVISSNFIHVQFESCHFQAIKCVLSNIYLESWYFLNNQIQSWQNGFFVKCVGSFDVSILGNCVEGNNVSATASFFQSLDPSGTTGAYGLRIIDNLIEGVSGAGLVIDGSRGVIIQGNYFEANGTGTAPNYCINLAAGSILHSGLTIAQNFFGQNPSYPTAYNILWGTTQQAMSLNNFCFTYLHNNSGVTAPNLNVTSINDQANTQLWSVARGNIIVALMAQSSSGGSGAGPFTPACEKFSYFQYSVSSSTVTINNPTGGVNGQELIIQIFNSSGVAITAVTFGSLFKAQTWTSLAANYTCNIRFLFDGVNWREIARSGAIPN
jgi:hypothetical protein